MKKLKTSCELNFYINEKGYGKRYYEFRKYKKEIIDEIYYDILDKFRDVPSADVNNKVLVHDILTIISQHYFK